MDVVWESSNNVATKRSGKLLMNFTNRYHYNSSFLLFCVTSSLLSSIDVVDPDDASVPCSGEDSLQVIAFQPLIFTGDLAHARFFGLV